MKKPHDYKTLSRYRCRCGKLIKLNLADRKLHQDAMLCYACYKKEQKKRGHNMN